MASENSWYDPTQGSSKGVTRPGGPGTTPHFHGNPKPKFAECYGDTDTGQSDESTLRKRSIQSQNDWRKFVAFYKPYIIDAVRDAKKRFDQDQSSERQRRWYDYCLKSHQDFVTLVSHIESCNGHHNEELVKESIELIRLTHILDQNDFEQVFGRSLRAVESAPTLLTSSEDKNSGSLRLHWKNWVEQTRAIETQLTDAIQLARNAKDQSLMMLLKEKLKNLQRFVEAKNLEISAVLKGSDDETAQHLIFEALEDLYSEAYDPAVHKRIDVDDLTQLPANYQRKSTGPVQHISSQIPRHHRHRKPPLIRQIDEILVTNTSDGPVMQRSQYQMHAGPTEALIRMRSRTKHIGRIPKPRSVSAMSVTDRLRIQNRTIASQAQFLNRQEQIRLGESTEPKSMLPMALTEAERQRLRAKKEHFDRKYEDDFRTARAVGPVKKLIRELDEKDFVHPDEKLRLQHLLRNLLRQAYAAKAEKSHSLADTVMTELADLEAAICSLAIVSKSTKKNETGLQKTTEQQPEHTRAHGRHMVSQSVKKLDHLRSAKQLTAQERIQRTARKKEQETSVRAHLASVKALNSVKKCMQDLRIPAIDKHSTRHKLRETDTETDIMSAMESSQPLTSMAALTKKLQDLLVVAKKGKALKSQQICEAVVKEVDGLRSILKTHPATGQLGVLPNDPSSANSIEYWLNMYAEVEMANNEQLEQLRLAGDASNFQLCTSKIDELACSKAKYDSIIQEAARNHDIDKLAKTVFDAINTLETSQYLCGDPTKDGRPNLKVTIQALPKLRERMAEADRRRTTQRMHLAPSGSEASLRRPPSGTKRNEQAVRPHLMNLQKASKTKDLTTQSRPTTPAPQQLKQGQSVNRPKHVFAKPAASAKRVKSTVDVRQLMEPIRQSDSSVSLQEQELRRAVQQPHDFARRKQSEAIRKAKENFDRRKRVQSSASVGSTSNLARPSSRLGGRDQIRSARGSAKQPRSAALAVNLQKLEADMQRAKEKSVRRSMTNPSAIAQRFLTAEERQAIVTRDQMARANLEAKQLVGAQRRLQAEQAAANSNRFGAQGRVPTLPKTELHKITVTEADKQRIQEDYQNYMSAKKSIGGVRKQLFGTQEYRDNRQRHGVKLPERNVQPKLPQYEPYAEPSKAYLKYVEQQKIKDKVEATKRLLSRAARIKSGPRAEQVREQLAAVALPAEPSIRNRPVLNIENREFVEETTRRPIKSQPLRSGMLRRDVIRRYGRIVNDRNLQRQSQKNNQDRRREVDGLKKFWFDTKENLLRQNDAAVLWTETLHSQMVNRSTERHLQDNMRKQKDALHVADEEGTKIMAAIAMGDVELIDIAVFDALERLFQDAYVCVGNPKPSLKPGQRGYRRQQMRLINERIASALQASKYPRKCGVYPVTIDGVEIPIGWIHPTDEQILKKFARNNTILNQPLGLQDLIQHFPLAEQNEREPRNEPGALPFTRLYVNENVGRNMPYMFIDPVLTEAIGMAVDEAEDSSDMFSDKVGRMLEDDCYRCKYEESRQRLNEFDDQTIYELILAALGKSKKIWPALPEQAPFVPEMDSIDLEQPAAIAEQIDLMDSDIRDPVTHIADRLSNERICARETAQADSKVDVPVVETAASTETPVPVELSPEIRPRNNVLVATAASVNDVSDQLRQKQPQQQTQHVHYVCGDEKSGRNWFQLRGSLAPDWFPGFFTAFPGNSKLMMEQRSPSQTLVSAWATMKPSVV